MTNEYLSNRYGKSKAKARTQRILWVSLGALLLVVFFVWAILINFAAPAQISATVKNFTISSAQQAAVTISVANPTERDGTCVVRVLSSDFSVVGYREVTITGTLGKSVDLDSKVNTTIEGVSANVERCWFK
jgi:cytoskeletal protein RodZ